MSLAENCKRGLGLRKILRGRGLGGSKKLKKKSSVICNNHKNILNQLRIFEKKVKFLTQIIQILGSSVSAKVLIGSSWEES